VGLVFLKGVVWRSDKLKGYGPGRDHAGLCRYEGHGPVEIMAACTSLRASPSGDHAGLCRCEGCSPAEFKLLCVGLKAWPSGDCEYLYSWLGRPWGRGPVERKSCRPVQTWERSRAEVVCVDPLLGSP
jgi:hypothetical protein